MRGRRFAGGGKGTTRLGRKHERPSETNSNKRAELEIPSVPKMVTPPLRPFHFFSPSYLLTIRPLLALDDHDHLTAFLQRSGCAPRNQT